MFYSNIKLLGSVLLLKTVPSTAEKVISTYTGNEFSMSYDAVKQKVKLEAVVPDNMYFSIGFGTSMRDTDMVIF
jgi:hypothetical protein